MTKNFSWLVFLLVVVPSRSSSDTMSELKAFIHMSKYALSIKKESIIIILIFHDDYESLFYHALHSVL